MKKRKIFIKAIIVASIIALVCTACAESDKEIDVVNSSTNVTQSTEVNASTEIATQATQKATEATTEANESAEKQIVLDIYNQVWGSSEGDEFYSSDLDGQDDVDRLSDRYLGAITSEEDAVEKGQTALIELFGREDNYYEYKAEFKEEYGVWVVRPTFPPATVDENGKCTGTVGTVMYIVIRQSDGKALGTFVG